jgi:hypothetical protein
MAHHRRGSAAARVLARPAHPAVPRLAHGPGSRVAELGTASLLQRLRSATTSAKLSADDMRTVSAAAREHGMTDFMLVLGAYAATLRPFQRDA